MGCHMCWTEFYRLCDVRMKQARERQGVIKIKTRELMDSGYKYGTALYLATFGSDGESQEGMDATIT